MPEYISNAVHERIMAKRDDNLRTIKIWLPTHNGDQEAYDRGLEEMYAEFSRQLKIPVERVKEIEATCVGHADYAAKFALRLAFEYWGIE